MGDFKEIHAVKAGIDALVAFIIGTAVQHFVIDDQVIVAKEHFSNQGKSWFELFAECAETSHKVVVQAVSNIEAQSVNAEFFNPESDTIQQVICDCRILQIQLNQLEMAFPALIPKAIVITAVAVKINEKPVLVRRFPFLFLYILKCPKTAAYMVEDPIQHDFDIMGVQRFTYVFKIFIRAEAAVYFFKIPGIISVIIGFKNRIQNNGSYSKLLEISSPLCNLTYTGYCDTVIMDGGVTKSNRIYLIESFIISPHKFHLLSKILLCLYNKYTI